MAGFSKIYCIGGEGGFLGSDGINPIALQIWQGEGNRMWFEVHYFDRAQFFDRTFGPIGLHRNNRAFETGRL